VSVKRPSAPAPSPEHDAISPEAPDPAVRERLLAALRGRERWTPFAPALAQLFAVTQDDALDALQRIEDPAAWQPGLWPGSQLLRTPALAAASTLIARIPAGTRIPHHRHACRELTYILDGELLESGSDRVHGTGVMVDRACGTAHELAVLGGSPCLVVFALRVD
jgi:anti-sigma factor ChrR (cupin superfamily)